MKSNQQSAWIKEVFGHGVPHGCCFCLTHAGVSPKPSTSFLAKSEGFSTVKSHVILDAEDFCPKLHEYLIFISTSPLKYDVLIFSRCHGGLLDDGTVTLWDQLFLGLPSQAGVAGLALGERVWWVKGQQTFW